MDYSVLEKSVLFSGVPAADLRNILERTPYGIQCYDRGETIFRLMEEAARIGIILEGSVEAQKSFPNGSQVNVAVRGRGEMIGPAAAFSKSCSYPCDIVALEHVAVMMLRRGDLLKLMQQDLRILENFTREMASATYMLQRRLELLSYNGIKQKAAFWLLTQMRQTGARQVKIPESFSKWALQMNVSRPSLHRELKRLEELNMIVYSPRAIEILDPGALERLLSC